MYICICRFWHNWSESNRVLQKAGDNALMVTIRMRMRMRIYPYKDEDGDPGRRLRQEGWQRLEETFDKKGRKKMANELETHTGDVTEKVKRNCKRLF